MQNFTPVPYLPVFAGNASGLITSLFPFPQSSAVCKCRMTGAVDGVVQLVVNFNHFETDSGKIILFTVLVVFLGVLCVCILVVYLFCMMLSCCLYGEIKKYFCCFYLLIRTDGNQILLVVRCSGHLTCVDVTRRRLNRLRHSLDAYMPKSYVDDGLVRLVHANGISFVEEELARGNSFDRVFKSRLSYGSGTRPRGWI